jgi:hypothetical protein
MNGICQPYTNINRLWRFRLAYSVHTCCSFARRFEKNGLLPSLSRFHPRIYNISTLKIIVALKAFKVLHISSINSFGEIKKLYTSPFIYIYIYTVDLQLETITQILLCKRQPGCWVKKSTYKCEIKDGKNWCWSLHLFLQAPSEAVHW